MRAFRFATFAFASLPAALALAVALTFAFVAGTARAGDIAPALEAEELHDVARAALEDALEALEVDDRRRLVGTYVAFDPDVADAFALAACDDDGDHVVVLSEALLRLAADVARLEAADDALGTRKVEEYAGFLARAQLPDRKLLPPPPGSYAVDAGGRIDPAARRHLAGAVAFVVGHEIARLRAGDVRCPRPTATRESGDTTWTREERRRALEGAERVYRAGASQVARDEEAATRVAQSGRDLAGALGLLRFFEQLERERLTALGRFAPTYLAHHPSSPRRAATVRAAEAAVAARRER
jgi:ABC-type amino acid transport substrate-binding protein